MTTEENDTVEIDVKKLVPISIAIGEMMDDMTALEKAFIFSSISWAMFREHAAGFMDICKELIPSIVNFANTNAQKKEE